MTPLTWQQRLEDFVVESNAIERIDGASPIEVQAHREFLELAPEHVTVGTLWQFVMAVRGGPLRNVKGRDVTVGRGAYSPPPGGPDIAYHLDTILSQARKPTDDPKYPWLLHCAYEALHPFMDGNGRSGRVLWAWMMIRRGYNFENLFLHQWYYQTLEHNR